MVRALERAPLPTDRPRASGFTLVELLIVLSIIALLVGVLMPALAAARNAAHAVQCGSRMRQLGVATASYLHDFDATYPQPTQDGYYDTDRGYPAGEKQRNCWYNALDPYIAEYAEQYVNSSDRNNVAIKQDPAWHRLDPDVRKHNKTIKMNEHFGVRDDDAVKWVRAFHIRQPARTVVFGDGRGNDLSDEHPSWSIPGYFHLRPSYIGLRHNGAANIAFADGHAERVSQATRTVSISGEIEEIEAWHDVGDARQTLVWEVP